ncbi:MAG: transcription-repair coupling factor [Gammaproteobacteria bacterium]|nr:MAG: transcription-repair coupling factor [Gammaproteobacteria bacterium]
MLPALAHTDTAHWPELPLTAWAWVLPRLQQRLGHPLLVLTEQPGEAERLVEALAHFGPAHLRARLLPDWETLPYDSFSPHQDIVSARIRCLHDLANNQLDILVAPVAAAMHRLAPKSHLMGQVVRLRKGDRLDLQYYRTQLAEAGYRSVETVYEHGEFAVRGSIIDVFPSGADAPIRIELFDDEIDSLRTFDPETQRSLNKTEQVELLPAHEFPMDREAVDAFARRFHEHFADAPRDIPMLEDLRHGMAPGGIEYWLPLFFDKTASLTDYLPGQATVIALGNWLHSASDFWQYVNQRHADMGLDPRRPLMKPAEICLTPDQLGAALKTRPRAVTRKDVPCPEIQALPDVSVEDQAPDPLHRLRTFIDQPDARTVICAETAGRAEMLQELLTRHGIEHRSHTSPSDALADTARVCLCIADLPGGCVLAEAGIALVTESDLFTGYVPQKRRRQSRTDDAENVFQSLTELKPGAPVVHMEHGIGRYRGLERIAAGGVEQEFLVLEYAEGSKLYVPVTSLNLISRYTGLDESLAPLHKLGSERWSNAREKALKKIRDTAAELLEVYARREARKGYAFPPPDAAYQAFAAGFPFEETPDQQAAIAAVIQDMTSPRPMDRLVCGDVGFGKTEVAMRAAFIAANAGKQVAVLVPTTLLAQQHYNSFVDRFAGTAVQIELLSRFRSGKQTESALQRLAEGKVDIVIGTHKLLQPDVKFRDLGLLIVDEEHRFGVQQKEKIKALRANVDILALTATPIPRTLNLSLGGLRDLSVISTPPQKRLSVRTFIQEKSDGIIKEAVRRELLRGGQVFYLYNEVKTIERCASELAELVPEARIAVAHGQMRERELEKIMSDFYHKRFNVLVCTTIIETGIDIPSANTILIERADTFGLAQLHQLRGRVGRSHHQAYAYLMTPPASALSRDARKRLEAIAEAQDLGAGFILASHDMEIRGAGELLGEEQSGHMETVGFSLFMELLDETVKAMREGRELSLEDARPAGCEISLRIPALIPDSYLPDVNQRLRLYKRLASCRDEAALQALQIEMIDRFGLLPDEVKFLVRQTRLRMQADQLGIVRIDIGTTSGTLEFAKHTRVEPLQLIQLIQNQPDAYRLAGGDKLTLLKPPVEPEERLHYAEHLLTLLEPRS